MTRRWLLQLGGSVVLGGWSGVDVAAADLPPGVYGPSREHLGHVLAGHVVEAGGETELFRPRAGSFEPAFFSRNEYQTLLHVVASILGEPPETPVIAEIAEWIDLTTSESNAVRTAALALSSPHRILAIHYYGPEAVRKLEEFDAQSTLREGIAWLDAESSTKYQRKFNSLDNQEQVTMIRSILDTSPNPGVSNTGTKFLGYLKHRVIEGFYTSRVGLSELEYKGNAFYASPPGCEHRHG